MKRAAPLHDQRDQVGAPSANGPWPRVPLREVVIPRPGVRDPRTLPEGRFSYVDISAVDNQSKRIVTPQSLLGRDAPSRARNAIRHRDVIVSTTRPNLNAVALVPSELDNEICSTGFCVLRAGPNLSPEYLFAFVQSPAFIDPLVDFVKGALYPAVNDSQVLGLEIPLPPLAEQERIARRLTEELAAVDQARAAAAERLAAVEALPAAYLRAVFEGSDSQNWQTVPVAEVCAVVEGQVDPREPEFAVLPHVNGENIQSGTGRILEVRTAAEDGLISGKYLFEAGMVLYSKLRPYLRKVAIAPCRGVCSADMYPLTFDSKRVDNKFAMWSLLALPFTRYAVRESERARMPKLNREQLFAWNMSLPPIAEQRRIAGELARRLGEAERLAATASAELAAIEALPAALLRRAFEGTG